MAITRFESTDFTNKKISELSNTPNIDGMSANDLKARFDAMPQQIADLLNTRLIDILNSTTDGSSGADNIASTTIEGIVGTTVQAIMENIATLSKGNATNINGLVKSVTYDGATGVFTITKFDDSYTTIDTPLEKVVTNFRYDQATESLILTYPDGTTTSISLSSFISEYDFLDSASIKFTVSNHKVTANLDQSYYDTLEGFKNSASASATNASTYADNASASATQASGYATNASNSATSASGSATSASGSATSANTKKLEAEGWAVGKQNGEDVGEGSPYYQNNAKYYAQQAHPGSAMLKGVYDTHNKNQDVFDYVDSGLANKQDTMSAGQGIKIQNNAISVEEELVGGLINQWDEQWELGYWNYLTGEFISNSSFFCCKNKIPVSHGTTIWWQCPSNVREMQFYDANGNPLGQRIKKAEGEVVGKIIIPNNCYFITFYFGNTYGTNYNNDISINYPSSYTGYYPSKLPRTNAHIGGLGNSIGNGGFNQLVKNGNFASTNGITAYDSTLSVSGNVLSCTNSGTNPGFRVYINMVANHKYLYLLSAKRTTNGSIYLNNINGYNQTIALLDANTWVNLSIFTTATGTANAFNTLIALNEPTLVQFKDYMCIDLTAMFGAGNEPTTVADFRAMFPSSYYPYNSGSFGDLLWTNARPTSSFASQTVSVDLSKYRYVFVIFNASTSYTTYCETAIIPMNYNYNVSGIVSNKLTRRIAQPISSGVVFNDGIVYNTYGSGSADNTLFIPYQIYGIR